jgi:type I restriction enzyme M protein
MSEIRSYADLIWGVAELLRGDYKQADYGKVILPLVLMRRLDQTLESTKDAVVAKAEQLEAMGTAESGMELVLLRTAKLPFYNRSKVSFPGVLDDQNNVAQYLKGHIEGYSKLAREVIDKFDFERQIDRLDEADLLFQIVGRICKVDLHPDKVDNIEMGYIFEELIRRFSEASNETAGEHFTPREVVKLMVNLLLDGDEEVLREPGVIRTVFDPACGTGGMLTEADTHIRELNPGANVLLYGQELNPESYAICLADMLVKGKDPKIVNGNSLSNDGHAGQEFHYGIANPPFGVDWSKVEKDIKKEHNELGFDGRFGPGLPRKSDGQLLFLLHLMSKMRDPEAGGSRIAIVFNGSPLFSGAAGSGESEIRKWIIENDMLEAIVALPEQLFYNTGIATYIWLVTNRKSTERVGKVQLIDARDMWERVRKSLGEKRREIAPEQIDAITALHGTFEEADQVKILPNEAFGYRVVTIDRPLRGYWEFTPATWVGLSSEKGWDNIEPATVDAVAGALRALGSQRHEDAASLQDVLKAAVVSVLPKPSAPQLRALVARCFQPDPHAAAVRNAKGDVELDPDLRASETIPLDQDVAAYLDREVMPHLPDAQVADAAGKVGYEIPFTRFFFRETSTRPSAEIKEDLRHLEADIRRLLGEVLV